MYVLCYQERNITDPELRSELYFDDLSDNQQMIGNAKFGLNFTSAVDVSYTYDNSTSTCSLNSCAVVVLKLTESTSPSIVSIIVYD